MRGRDVEARAPPEVPGTRVAGESHASQPAEPRRAIMRKALTAMLLCAVASAAHAAALSRVDTSAPLVNCVFDPGCTILVADSSDTIVLPGGAGSGFLQSRTYIGQPGTQAEGLYGYEYRIDLREISGTPAPSVVTFAIDFGRVVPLDYNADGVTEHVYIVTAGGLGSIGPDYADKTGNKISFHFCGGVTPGTSSFFFGLASRTEEEGGGAGGDPAVEVEGDLVRR